MNRAGAFLQIGNRLGVEQRRLEGLDRRDVRLGRASFHGDADTGLHQVHTAVAVVLGQQIELALNTTLVEMMPLSDAMIATYIASNEHSDKAGSYAIQGLAGSWIKRIDGSYTGVMGLPVHETAMLLNKVGLLNTLS